MTTAEAKERLKEFDLTERQATGVVDVLERWERERVVTREYLDARLAEYYGKISDRLQAQTEAIGNKLQAQTESIANKLQAQTESVANKLHAQTLWIAGTVALGVIVQHIWK
jgi:hypothetical protein